MQERIDTWGEKEAPVRSLSLPIISFPSFLYQNASAANVWRTQNDLITWLLENAPEDRRTVEHLLMAIIVVNMAAIHTSSNVCFLLLFFSRPFLYVSSLHVLFPSPFPSRSSLHPLFPASSKRDSDCVPHQTFAYVLFHLASHPECVEPMLQEVEQVTEEMGWTKAAMNMMRKVDSFIRESQRISNLGSCTSILPLPRPPIIFPHQGSIVSMRRTVIHPSGFTFSDGTHLPKGTLVLVATAAIHLDEKNFVNPAEFDGMRFAKMREGGEREDSARHQMVNTNGTNLSFGNGRHACPGR